MIKRTPEGLEWPIDRKVNRDLCGWPNYKEKTMDKNLIKRMANELEVLGSNIRKANVACDNSKITQDQRDLIKIQIGAMKAYYDVLGLRLVKLQRSVYSDSKKSKD